MNIKLVTLSHQYKNQLFDMVTEWKKDIEAHNTDGSPWAIFRNDFHDFDYYLENLEIKQETPDGKVPDTTLFGLDVARDIFVGAINIRHYLTQGLLHTGGHIGYGIRPSEKRKGYATAMLALALQECKKLGIERVLMTCDKTNIGSAKTIVKNGGVLENEVWEEGVLEQRYWIDVKTFAICTQQ
ncbi:MAG: GNAT family N-acetyltransferase [Treponema sp.]